MKSLFIHVMKSIMQQQFECHQLKAAINHGCRSTDVCEARIQASTIHVEILIDVGIHYEASSFHANTIVEANTHQSQLSF